MLKLKNLLNEAISIPVEVGDVVLIGKFKNKKVVVTSIGTDEHGMPTINGKKCCTFKLQKAANEISKKKLDFYKKTAKYMDIELLNDPIEEADFKTPKHQYPTQRRESEIIRIKKQVNIFDESEKITNENFIAIHNTTEKNYNNILKNGFKINNIKNTRGKLFGTGIYFTPTGNSR